MAQMQIMKNVLKRISLYEHDPGFIVLLIRIDHFLNQSMDIVNSA